MYELHGKEGAVKLINSYQNTIIQNMLKEMLAKRMLVENPDEALEYAIKNSPKLLTNQEFMGHLARTQCTNKTVDEIIQYISSFELTQTSQIAASAVGGMMYTNDPALTDKTILSIMSITDTPLRDTLIESYLATAIELNPEILLHPSVKATKLDDEIYYKAGNMMSGKSWEEVLVFNKDIKNTEYRSRFMLGYIDSLTEQGSGDIALRQSIELYNTGVDDGQLMARTLENMSRYSPDKVSDFLLGNYLPPEVKSTLSENLIGSIAAVDLAQAQKIAQSGQFSGMTQERILADMATHAAQDNPEKALVDIYAKIQDPVFSNLALSDITSQFYSKDSERCMSYISSLSPGVMRDNMVRTVAQKMMSNDPQGALNYATQISDGQQRIAALSAMFENSRHYQPSLVQQWAANNPEIMKSMTEYEKSQANQPIGVEN
jgi:hypothetical protein